MGLGGTLEGSPRGMSVFLLLTCRDTELEESSLIPSYKQRRDSMSQSTLR